VFYTEGVDNCKVFLQFLSDCKKRLFETTLLDNFDNYDLLGTASVAKMAVFNQKTNSYMPHREDKYKSATEDNDSRFRDWVGFKYTAHGRNPISQHTEPIENISHYPKAGIIEARALVLEGMKAEETLSWVERLPAVKPVPVVDLSNDVAGKNNLATILR
jgi:hypothetical protein